jgi:hypothetical protein
VHVPEETQSYVIEHALETLLNRKALRRHNSGIIVDNSEGNLIDFYANSISHLI